MVFKTKKDGVMTKYTSETIDKMKGAGLDLRIYFSTSEKEVFCEMRASVERLMKYADQVLVNSHFMVTLLPQLFSHRKAANSELLYKTYHLKILR